MITGNIKSIETYKGLSAGIDMAIDFILNIGEKTDGDYEIDGKNVYAMINTIQPKSLDDMVYEAHEKYIDLHYMLEGTEVLGYEKTELCTPITEYNKEEDYRLYNADGNLIKLEKGDFYIVHSFDAHAPECNVDGKRMRKVIIKIKV